MITLYTPTETTFTHNGLGVLLPTEATVTEELNGAYELEMICHTAEDNKTWKYLDELFILKAPTPTGHQLFRIYKVSKRLDGSIGVNARHIFYDGLYNNLDTAVAGNFSADAAIKRIYNSLNYGTPFSVSSSVTRSGDIDLRDINAISAILGDRGLVEVYGGELLRDNYMVELKPALGTDRGFVIRYRKNLTGLDYEDNIEKTATRVKPQGYDGSGNPLLLPELYIDSPRINQYPYPLISIMPLNDIRVGEGLTYEQALAEMRSRVAAFFDSGGDLPVTNAKVDFILLRQTEEYKEFAPLEKIFLGDSVAVIHEGLDVAMKSKCIKYAYDAILERYTRIELGAFRNDIAASIGNVDRQVSSMRSSTIGIREELDTLYASYNELKSKFASHAHKGADGTARISYADLTDKP